MITMPQITFQPTRLSLSPVVLNRDGLNNFKALKLLYEQQTNNEHATGPGND
jgi:hypothetical protein